MQFHVPDHVEELEEDEERDGWPCPMHNMRGCHAKDCVMERLEHGHEPRLRGASA